ncbi:MAG: serine/threonine protein kinase [Kiritimatiellae bacterium]|nr:serine/threonine protein kinase [Kiritimatiellia bacterium]
MTLLSGQLFANDFELLRPLGEGGMGEVWLARERPLGREVALKIMRESDGPARSERFAREARALAALDHPSILPVLRSGEDPATRRPFLATRAVLLSPDEIRRLCRETLGCPLPQDGGASARPISLADLLDGGKALPQTAVLRVARDLAGALGAAHAAGILHRDVKPSNVLFDAAGRALLADFGLAKFVPRRSSPVASAAQPPDSISLDGEGRAKFLGSPAYAAPEQFDPGAPATPAMDWYSFGAVLCRALTGHRPGSPRKPSSFDPGHVSRAWDPFLSALLEPDPARRLSEAAAVLRALDRVERRMSGRSPVRLVALPVLAVCAAACAAAYLRRAEPASPAEPTVRGAEAGEAELPPVAPPGDVDPVWAKIASYSVYGGVPRVVARLEGRYVALSRPLRFDGPLEVEIVGPGRLDAEISGMPAVHVSILGASVVNLTEDGDPLHSPRFRLGAGAFLAMPKILSIFPRRFADPYDEPDPENPKPGDRALRFSTPARSLAEQMQLERVRLAESDVVAAGDELVAAPELGRELGWTNAVWRTSAAHPWVVDEPGDGAVVGLVFGGVGESVLEARIENQAPCRISVEGYFPGRADHGGRGAAFEILDGDNVVFVADRDRHPANGATPVEMSFYPGRHVIRFRLRSDLWAPDGHCIVVRLRRLPD